jgi:hypothetical protein
MDARCGYGLEALKDQVRLLHTRFRRVVATTADNMITRTAEVLVFVTADDLTTAERAIKVELVRFDVESHSWHQSLVLIIM